MIRYFDTRQSPLPNGENGPYQLECTSDQEWNNSGCPCNIIWENDVPRLITEAEKLAQKTAVEKAAALGKTIFTRLQIRRALRDLGIESTLDNLLDTSETFKKDWSDASEIDLSDTITAAALSSVSIDLDAVKLKIAGIA